MRRRLVYVAGPFSGDVAGNIHRAIETGQLLWRTGRLMPLIPHLFFHWEMLYPAPYEEMMERCFCLLDGCDALYRMPGASPGADREVSYANLHQIPVFTKLTNLTRWSKS